MKRAPHEQCAQGCALLEGLEKERRDIEDRRAAIEQVGLNGTDTDALDTEQMRPLDDAIVHLKQSLEALGCDCANCNDAAATGSASPGLSPASPALNP